MTCPVCRCPFKSSPNVSREADVPEDGDWALCVKCGARLRFHKVLGQLGQLELRATTRAERDAEMSDEVRARVSAIFRMMRGTA